MGCSSSVTAKAAMPSMFVEGNFHDNYLLGKKIGAGAFGQVRLAVGRKPEMRDQELVVKVQDARQRGAFGEPIDKKDQKLADMSIEEVKIWQQVGVHENVVKLKAAFLHENVFYMVMEKCDCDLTTRLEKAGSLSEVMLKRTFMGMLMGIRYIHDTGVVHRDIKLDNFLFAGEKVKLCDFGLAAQLPKKSKLFRCVGTPPYMSPEMLGRTTGYDQSTDLWSFGVSVYLLLFGEFPYMPAEVNAQAMKAVILKGVPEPSFAAAEADEASPSPTAVAFAQSLIQRSPELRESAAQVLASPFFSREGANSNMSLGSNMRKAKQLTRDLHEHVSPIAEKGLDELLDKLQQKGGGRVAVGDSQPNFFSEEPRKFGENDQEEQEIEEQFETRIVRRGTRTGTHSGVVSEKFSFIESLRDPVSTNDGGSSLGSGSEQSINGNSPLKIPKALKDMPDFGDSGLDNGSWEGFTSSL